VTPINFHDSANYETYTGREASLGWRITLTSIRDPLGLDVIDAGCGGGIYTRAIAEMGAASVVGIDSSDVMLAAARTTCIPYDSVQFVHAAVDAVPVPDHSGDLILARALVHHLPDLQRFAEEMHRLLRPDGTLIIQDRTPADVNQIPSPENLRGYFFERYPDLRKTDLGRRPELGTIVTALERAGFTQVSTSTIDEVRTIHRDRKALMEDLHSRKGRSILHDLDDAQLEDLASYVSDRVPATGPIIERDRWTLWVATKTSTT